MGKNKSTPKHPYFVLKIPLLSPVEIITKSYQFLLQKWQDPADPLRNIKEIKELQEAFNQLQKNKDTIDSKLLKTQQKVQKYFNEGIQQINKGSATLAKKNFEKARLLDPFDPELIQALSLCLRQEDKAAEAMTLLLGLSELPISHPLTLKYIGELFIQEENHLEGEKTLLRALKEIELTIANPSMSDNKKIFQEARAEIFWLLGKKEEALSSYRELIKEYGEADYNLQLVLLFYEMDRLDEGISLAESIEFYGSKDPTLFLYLGLLYFKKRFLQKAMVYLHLAKKEAHSVVGLEKLMEKITEIIRRIGKTIEEQVAEKSDSKQDHTGLIKWYNLESGMGYLEEESGLQVFLHFSAIKFPETEILFKAGVSVLFSLFQDIEVGPVAANCQIYDPESDKKGGDEINSEWFPGEIVHYSLQGGQGILWDSEKNREVVFQKGALAKSYEPKKGEKILYQGHWIQGLSEKKVFLASRVKIRPQSS